MPINGSLHAIFCLNSTDGLGQVSSDFDYDHTNQLTDVTLVNRSGESYGYDASNQWVAKQVTAGTGTPSLSYYIYDGGQIVLDFDGTEVSDLDHRYLWGPNVDQLLAAETVTSTSVDGDVHYPLTDNLGSVRDLFDPNSGAVEKHFYYDSFGNLTTVSDYNTPTESLLFGYTGRMFDSNTGLQNNLNRWYDPAVGRWISEDPIGFAAGDANLYRYVGNEPVNYTDPNGLRRNNVQHFKSDWAGRQLLRWWLIGGGKNRWIMDNAKWSEYMKADKSLRLQVRGQLLREASRLAETYINADTSTILSFRASLENGEGVVGYQYLHGTNPDFKIFADAKIRHSNGRRGRPCATVTFNARFMWNDVIDPNRQYDTDTIKSILGEAITLGRAEDYDIHISWKETVTVTFDNQGRIMDVQGWPYLYGPPEPAAGSEWEDFDIGVGGAYGGM